jgi:rhamnulokinase
VNVAARPVAAVDLGATSGRVMLGRASKDELSLRSVERFPNAPVTAPDGHLHWDYTGLARHVELGLTKALAEEPSLRSIGIDSWAADYGLVDAAGQLLGEPFHYRDPRTIAGTERVHSIVPFADLYHRNGLQYLPLTTVYQFAAETRLDEAEHALLIPDLLGFQLTGSRVAERTNASTPQRPGCSTSPPADGMTS